MSIARSDRGARSTKATARAGDVVVKQVRTHVAVVGYGYWGSKHVRVLSTMPDVAVAVVDEHVEPARGGGRLLPVGAGDGHGPRRRARPRRRGAGGHAARSARGRRAAGDQRRQARPGREAAWPPRSPTPRHGRRAPPCNGVQLMVGHTFEYNAAVRRLREIIRSGALGRVLYIDSARLSLGRYQRDVNVIWDLAPHDISIASFLLDDLPVADVGVGRPQRRTPWREDVAYLRLDFPTTRAFVHVSWLNPNKVRRTTVVGERKMAVYDDMSDNERIRIYDIGVDPAEHRRPAQRPRTAGQLPHRRHRLAVRGVPRAAAGAGPRTSSTRSGPGDARRTPGRARSRHRARARRHRRRAGDRAGRLPVADSRRGVTLGRARRPRDRVAPTRSLPRPRRGARRPPRRPRPGLEGACSRTGGSSAGPRSRRFEAAFAEYCGAEHCVGVAQRHRRARADPRRPRHRARATR